MRQKLWCIGFLLLGVLASGAAFADQDHRKTEDAFDKMMREGWKPVAPGVLQIHKGDNRVETFAVGPEGMRWALRQMTARLRFLEREYRTYPSDDLQRTITNLRHEVAELQEDVANAEKGDEPLTEGTEKNGCSATYSALADAYHLTSVQGVAASASASFDNNCGYYAETHAYAYSRATRGTLVETRIQEEPKAGYVINSSVINSVEGGPNCYSEAYSYARYSPQNIFRSASDSNDLCPAPPPSTLDGRISSGRDSFYFTNGDPCIYETWRASATGGTPGYSYTWYVNGDQIGTGDSYSRWVCYTDGWSFTLSMTAMDSASQTDSDSKTVSVMTLWSCPGPGCETPEEPAY